MTGRIISVVDRWDSLTGGIGTFNRHLCIALAQHGSSEVHVLCEVRPREREIREIPSDARAKLHFYECGPQPGADSDSARYALGAVVAIRGLPKEEVRLVIGHSRISGWAASLLRDVHYPDVPLLYVEHTDPPPLHAAKGSGRGQRHDETARALAAQADMLAGVGPTLTDAVARHLTAGGLYAQVRQAKTESRSYREGQLAPTSGEGKPVPLLNLAPPASPPGDRELPRTFVRSQDDHSVLTVMGLGRLDDPVKGADYVVKVAESTARLVGKQRRNDQQSAAVDLAMIHVVLIGAVPEDGVSSPSYMVKGIQISIDRVPPTADPAEVLRYLDTADAFLMPSRVEGYGLVALESLSRRTPTLISTASGVAREAVLDPPLLHAWGPWRLAPDSSRPGYDRWAKQLLQVFEDRQAAEKRVEEIAGIVDAKRNWKDLVEAIEASLTDAQNRRASVVQQKHLKASLRTPLSMIQNATEQVWQNVTSYASADEVWASAQQMIDMLGAAESRKLKASSAMTDSDLKRFQEYPEIANLLNVAVDGRKDPKRSYKVAWQYKAPGQGNRSWFVMLRNGDGDVRVFRVALGGRGKTGLTIERDLALEQELHRARRGVPNDY